MKTKLKYVEAEVKQQMAMQRHKLDYEEAESKQKLALERQKLEAEAKHRLNLEKIQTMMKLDMANARITALEEIVTQEEWTPDAILKKNEAPEERANRTDTSDTLLDPQAQEFVPTPGGGS